MFKVKAFCVAHVKIMTKMFEHNCSSSLSNTSSALAAVVLGVPSMKKSKICLNKSFIWPSYCQTIHI